jgi:hypothetical protein
MAKKKVEQLKIAKKKVKQSKEELDLLQARRDMDKVWVTLNKAITVYNLYLENKLKEKENKKNK